MSLDISGFANVLERIERQLAHGRCTDGPNSCAELFGRYDHALSKWSAKLSSLDGSARSRALRQRKDALGERLCADSRNLLGPGREGQLRRSAASPAWERWMHELHRHETTPKGCAALEQEHFARRWRSEYLRLVRGLPAEAAHVRAAASAGDNATCGERRGRACSRDGSLPADGTAPLGGNVSHSTSTSAELDLEHMAAIQHLDELRRTTALNLSHVGLLVEFGVRVLTRALHWRVPYASPMSIPCVLTLCPHPPLAYPIRALR